MKVLAASAALVLGATAFLATPAAAQSSFEDVSGTEFYGTAAEWLLQQGLTTGYGGTHDEPSPFFAPMVTIDRAQLVTFLWRMAGSPGGNPPDGFVDTAGDAYYTEAVRWARASGYTTGIGGTQTAPSPFFAPHDPVTRAQAFTLLWRYGGEPRWPKGTGPAQAYPPHQFQDTVEPSFYELALRWAKAEGLTTGYGGTHLEPAPIFVPDGHLTRGEMAAGVWRYAGNPAPDQPGNTEEGWWVDDDAPPPPPPPPPPPEVTITSPTSDEAATVAQGAELEVSFETGVEDDFVILLDDESMAAGDTQIGTNTEVVLIPESFELGTYDLTVVVGTGPDAVAATEVAAVTVVVPALYDPDLTGLSAGSANEFKHTGVHLGMDFAEGEVFTIDFSDAEQGGVGYGSCTDADTSVFSGSGEATIEVVDGESAVITYTAGTTDDADDYIDIDLLGCIVTENVDDTYEAVWHHPGTNTVVTEMFNVGGGV